MAERLYSVKQTADLLGTSAAEIRRWIDLGRLPAEQMAGAFWVSERSLVRFLTDRGIDLGQVLGDALEPREAAACPPTAPETASRPARGDAVARLAEAILHDALRRRADAVFLEPVPGTLTLKLRVDGRVREKPRFAPRLPTGLGPLLLARFRAMAHMAETGGHAAALSVHLDGRTQPFRLEERPTPHGSGLAIYPLSLTR